MGELPLMTVSDGRI